MKQIILLLAGILTCAMICGQTTTNFNYEASGNRTSRHTITMKSTSSQVDETKPEEVFTDQIEDQTILIYPNPVKSELTVDIKGLEENTEVAISLFDQGGRLVLTSDKTNGSTVLNLSHLTPGNYYMTIRIGDGTTRWKIVKQQ